MHKFIQWFLKGIYSFKFPIVHFILWPALTSKNFHIPCVTEGKTKKLNERQLTILLTIARNNSLNRRMHTFTKIDFLGLILSTLKNNFIDTKLWDNNQHILSVFTYFKLYCLPWKNKSRAAVWNVIMKKNFKRLTRFHEKEFQKISHWWSYYEAVPYGDTWSRLRQYAKSIRETI